MLLTSRQILLVLSVQPTEMGAMTSLNQVFFNVGQSLGPAISAAFLSAYVYTATIGGRPYTVPTSDAFEYIFWFGALLFVISFFVAVLGREVIGKMPNFPDSKGANRVATPPMVREEMVGKAIGPVQEQD